MMKESPLQARALKYLREHPAATMREVCEAIDVKPGFGNWGDFFYRMSERGLIRIVPIEKEKIDCERRPECPETSTSK